MRQQMSATRVAGWLIVAAVGLLLAGCDRCGDFPSPFKVDMQACRDTTPPRQ
jgi:hypothetical protein